MGVLTEVVAETYIEGTGGVMGLGAVRPARTST